MIAVLSPTGLMVRPRERLGFQFCHLCGLPPSPALQPCKHAAAYTQTELRLKPHVKLRPHMNTARKTCHAASQSQKTHTLHSTHKAPRLDKYCSPTTTSKFKRAWHFRLEINCLWVGYTHFWEMEAPHRDRSRCFFLYLISLSNSRIL